MATAVMQPTPRSDVRAPDHEAAVRTHLQALWRYLRRHGARHEEADDLAQEAFVIALQKGALAIEPAATAAFLQRTARFLFLRRRGNGRAAILLADAVDALWQQDAGGDDDHRLDATRACVEQLQGRARTAIELAYGFHAELDAQSRVAIAAALGMQENGVKTLLQRTRQWLRACIERSTRP